MQPISLQPTHHVPCAMEDHVRLFEAMLEHRNYLYRVAYSILHHAEDAEDAVQAAYLSAWSGWSAFRGQSTVKTWLTTIVMNKSLSELRTRRRRTLLYLDDDPALMAEAEWEVSRGQTSPEQDVIHDERMRWVMSKLASLPQQTQLVLLLRYTGDLSVDEIASRSNSTRHAVKSQLQRGQKALRKSLGTAPKRMARQMATIN